MPQGGVPSHTKIGKLQDKLSYAKKQNANLSSRLSIVNERYEKLKAKNNPREEEIRADNAARQEWNRTADIDMSEFPTIRNLMIRVQDEARAICSLQGNVLLNLKTQLAGTTRFVR